MPKITLNSGSALFEADSKVSILDAATAAGITLPYSCRTGRCGTCKCKLIGGQTTVLYAETGLDAEEKDEGWILGCARVANTDLLLEVECLSSTSLPPARTLPCRITSIERPAPDLASIRLRLPPASDFKFIPGQHIDVVGRDGLRRSYSLASAGPADGGLELHIRAVEGGAMSAYWFNLAKVDDLLWLRGPRGTFFLRDVSGVDLIFLATGTGIAPVKAMIESLSFPSSVGGPKSVTVLWGARTVRDLFLDIGRMPAVHRFIPVLSRAGDDWDGARGHVQDVLLARNPDLEDAVVYASGSAAMIRDARAALLRAGLPANRFRSDAFVCSGAPGGVVQL
jgi:CDP-4-dehydro-6-deoxyglucose reductase